MTDTLRPRPGMRAGAVSGQGLKVSVMAVYAPSL